MDLSIDAVGAARGVLMTLEGEDLVVRAARGEGFRISRTVRDRVLNEKTSLLVRDAQLDQAFAERMSIVQQQIRSMLAVPLQTNDRVIGLIYLDSPHSDSRIHARGSQPADGDGQRGGHPHRARASGRNGGGRAAMAKDMEQAALIQKRLLPTKAAGRARAGIGGQTRLAGPWAATTYDFLIFPDGRVALLVGDVAGQGNAGALLMSSLQARVQVLFEDADDLARKITRLNRAICPNCPDNRFITFLHDRGGSAATGEMVYTNAGHNPPLLVRAAGGFETLKGGGVILGIMPTAAYKETLAQLEPGDVLVLFSDGVTEAAIRQDEEFGEERLAARWWSLRNRPKSRSSKPSNRRCTISRRARRRRTILRWWWPGGWVKDILGRG